MSLLQILAPATPTAPEKEAEEILVALLRLHGPLRELAPEECWYPDAAPQAAKEPYLVYYRTGSAPSRTLKGRTGRQSVQLRADCYGEKNGAGRRMARLVVDAVDGRKGFVAGKKVAFAKAGEDRRSEVLPPIDGTPNPVKYHTVNIEIRHDE